MIDFAAAADRQADQCLFDAIRAFVAAHDHPGVVRFQEVMGHWGGAWRAVAPKHLPASDILAQALAASRPDTAAIVSLFVEHRATRKWEQSYTRADAVVGEDMLAGYGFAEVVGPHGPFLSTRVRAGIGVWGPNIVYPPHRHRAEETYIIVAGAAAFLLGEGAEATASKRVVGDVVHVPSMTTHGFRTRDDPVLILYLWQGSDLREKSSFG